MAFTWSGGTFGQGAPIYQDAVWSTSLGLFVVSNGGGGTGTDRISTSTDGASWTTRTTPDQSSFSLSWDETGAKFLGFGVGALMYSADGVTWSAGTAPDANDWYRAVYAPSLGLWIVVGGTGTQRAATSASGTASWTLRTTPNSAFTSIAWSPTLGIAVAVGTNVAMSSPDGTTWSSRTIGTAQWLNVFWSAALSKFVAFGWDGSSQSVIATSTDGTTWAANVVIDAQAYSGWAMDESTPRFIGILNDGTTPITSITSTDLSAWTEAAITAPYGTPAFGSGTHQGAFSPSLNKFVFVSENSTYNYLTAAIGTEGTFWYKSDVPGLDTGVDATTITTRPKGPRGQVDTSPFSSTNPLFGYPGHAIAYNNRLIYATSDYDIGTDLPPIRVWNGTSDYQLCTVPRDGSGNIPKCVTTIVNADGNVYLGTWDTGTSSANVAGRILKLDPNSGQLTNVGNVNSLTGYIPWALWFHNGELWAGLHRSNTSAGRIYRIKPEEQTSWTLDRDLTTDSVGPCTVINAYKGKMYFGSAAASGTFAKFGYRDASANYTLLYTGTGGTAQDYNGFYAATVFGDNLYFSYWNPDATEVSLIKKYDGTTVTTAFTVTSLADVPIIALFVHDGVLYAVGSRNVGGTWTSLLLTTPDGTTWTDRTGDLPLGTFTSRGITNAFASIAY